MGAFVPTPFDEPVVSPDTATLFRRTPYISPSEYQAAPTAVATKGLVPGGTAEDQEAALAAVINRASDWVDTFCFHRADGTLAASPSTESDWITVKDNGSIQIICNYKPILQINGLALGGGPGSLQNIGNEAAQTLTVKGQIIDASGCISRGVNTIFSGQPTTNGKIYAVWSYTNGFPHTFLAAEAKKGDSTLEVGPSTPGGTEVNGVYPLTQLTIHDGANTEVVVVSSVDGLVLNLQSPLQYDHELPTAPNTVRVSAVPWVVEQACISVASYLIKTRGSRAMVIPQSPSKTATPPKQAEGQSGGAADRNAAEQMLKPFVVPVLRST